MTRASRYPWIGRWGTMATALAVVLTSSTLWADVPRPEHPRPDAFRANWMNLNGPWQFEIDEQGDGEARGLTHDKTLAQTIVVPFCPESKLSGLGLGNSKYLTNVWYRRMVELPEAMKGQRILLHFGAVDYQTWVYVNGRLAGTHVGGSAAFQCEITDLLQEGENELVVRVFDDLRSGRQPGGKQALDQSEGCVYTRTTGIWQTVWLEAVGASYVENLALVPDPDHSRVLLDVGINGHDPQVKLTAEAFLDGKVVGSDSVVGPGQNHRLVLNLREKRLWEPGTPALYDLKLTLTRGNETVDTLTSYFGLRKVTIDGRRILINDKPVFQRLILDQGFYSDGIWTAPSDEALKRDIELSLAAGYNGARLHQKVFEPRFLYWADKLGYLVWGEFPNWGYRYEPESYSGYVAEWTEVLQRDRNHAALIGWCPFNETRPNSLELQQLVFQQTKAIDPTRVVLETSGWFHGLPVAELRDMHDYEGDPAVFRRRWTDYFGRPAIPKRYEVFCNGKYDVVADSGVPFMISEFGGIGWAAEQGWGYGEIPKNVEAFFARYQGVVDALLDNPQMFGFCYTQLTDVEQEHNGLYFYDRRPKFDLKRLHAITAREAAYERGEPTVAAWPRYADSDWRILVGSSQDGERCAPYRYTTETPPGEWTAEKYDDRAWASGLPPFGKLGKREGRTPWTTSDLYLRQTFNYDGSALGLATLVLLYDEDTEVYVNGQEILKIQGYVTAYQGLNVTDALRKALHKGSNTLVVHTHQSDGEQFVDLALLVLPPAKPARGQ